MTPRAATPTAPALALLFARYIAGQIADQPFQQLSTLFDETPASHAERTAFARFYLDASEDAVALPSPAEITELLALVA